MASIMAKPILRIREIAEKRGYQKPHALEEAMDISPSKATRLWKGEMDKIGLETILELCDFLNCSPNDLLARPDGKEWPRTIFRKR